MKKSTQILLTLFVPTMSTLGCYNQPSTVTRTQNDCSTPAKPGEPPKTPCDPNQATSNHRVGHGGGSFIFLPWGGMRSVNSNSNVGAGGTSTPISQPGSSNLSGGTHTGSASHSTSTSISHGGFGRTGSMHAGSSS